MSHLLWKYYWENDVDKFRRLLALAGPNTQTAAQSSAIVGSPLHLGSSPGSLASSPRGGNKLRRTSGYIPGHGRSKDGNHTLSKADINNRDHAGLTVLLRAVSSTESTALAFVQALIEHPSTDLYVQDLESGWNALHRALYSGNVSIARLLLAKERGDLVNYTTTTVGKVGQLIKTKDHEGNSPFDLYNSTIALRIRRRAQDPGFSDDGSDSGDIVGDLSELLVTYYFPSAFDPRSDHFADPLGSPLRVKAQMKVTNFSCLEATRICH